MVNNWKAFKFEASKWQINTNKNMLNNNTLEEINNQIGNQFLKDKLIMNRNISWIGS